MGEYLTLIDSKSLASGGNAPDENYARELMQACASPLKKRADGCTADGCTADGSARPHSSLASRVMR